MINKIDKPLTILTKKRQDSNHQYQKWHEGYNYTVCRYQKDNKRILRTAPDSYVWHLTK